MKPFLNIIQYVSEYCPDHPPNQSFRQSSNYAKCGLTNRLKSVRHEETLARWISQIVETVQTDTVGCENKMTGPIVCYLLPTSCNELVTSTMYDTKNHNVYLPQTRHLPYFILVPLPDRPAFPPQHPHQMPINL